MSGLLIYYTTVSDTYLNPNSVGENCILMLLLHKTLSLKFPKFGYIWVRKTAAVLFYTWLMM